MAQEQALWLMAQGMSGNHLYCMESVGLSLVGVILEEVYYILRAEEETDWTGILVVVGVLEAAFVHSRGPFRELEDLVLSVH